LLSWDGDWKYIYAPNGGRELLFHLESDPDELVDLAHHPDAESHKRRLREALVAFLANGSGGSQWLADGDLVAWPLTPIPLERYRKSGGKIKGGE
jgi:arylsulfatase A-like enzyme